jgi:DNA-binding PadR family transcriptional regulator
LPIEISARLLWTRSEFYEISAVDKTTTRGDTTRRVVDMTDPTVLVLSSLADGEKHGYAISQDIEAFAGLRLGPGTLYGAITRLEAKGWISAGSVDERRRPYRLTASGRRHLADQLAAMQQIVKAGMRRLEPA